MEFSTYLHRRVFVMINCIALFQTNRFNGYCFFVFFLIRTLHTYTWKPGTPPVSCHVVSGYFSRRFVWCHILVNKILTCLSLNDWKFIILFKLTEDQLILIILVFQHALPEPQCHFQANRVCSIYWTDKMMQSLWYALKDFGIIPVFVAVIGW